MPVQWGLPRQEARKARRGGLKQGVICGYPGTPGTVHKSLPLAAFLKAAGGKVGTPTLATKKETSPTARASAEGYHEAHS